MLGDGIRARVYIARSVSSTGHAANFHPSAVLIAPRRRELTALRTNLVDCYLR